MRRVVLAYLAVGTLVLSPGLGLAGTRVVVSGSIALSALEMRTIPVSVTSDMLDAKITGRLVASGGSGDDAAVYLVRRSDLEAWKADSKAPALFESGQVHVAEIDLDVEPGTYVLVLSNRFSSFTPKSVSGSVILSFRPNPDVPWGTALRARVSFKPLPADRARFRVSFNVGSATGDLTFTRGSDDESGMYSATVRRPEGTAVLQRAVGAVDLSGIEEIGAVDVDADGTDEVLLVNRSQGTGGRTTELMLISPAKLGITSVSLFESSQATERQALVSYDESLFASRFASERSFLERVAGAYAPVDGDAIAEDDPKNVFYRWARDNGTIEKGEMTIRRYPGKPAEFSSIEEELTDGPVTYRAYFKAGVIAYDAATDEHYVLFHPRDMYAWPTVLKKLGPYLIIGTRGEGLAIVDTRDLTLRRVPLRTQGTVERVEVVGTKIRVNGTVDLDAPGY